MKPSALNKSKKIILVSATFFLLLFIGILIFKNSILNHVINKVQVKLKQKYNCELIIQKAELTGFSKINLKNVTLVPKEKDTLLFIKNCTVGINFLPLITGNIQIQNLHLSNGKIQLIKNEKGANYETFLKSKTKNDDNSKKTDYGKLIYSLTNQLLNAIPEEMSLTSVELKLEEFDNKLIFASKKITLIDEQFRATTTIKTPYSTQDWTLTGTANPRKKKADIALFSNDTLPITIPFLTKKFGLITTFKKAEISITNLEYKHNAFHLEGKSIFEKILINHKKIAKEDVTISKCIFNYHTKIGKRYIELDSSSNFIMGKLKINPFFKIVKDQDTLIKVAIKIPEIKAQDFIESLPHGLFRHIEGMKAKGSFNYSMVFDFNLSKPEDLIFDSNLVKSKLKILQYGEANLTKLNSVFTYRAIENEIPQRPITVGPSNPNFVPINQISPYLLKCVLTSEDPSFFNHRGFIIEAFRESIIKNIKTKKFSRGGSTISMQLVKNVFLSREKTLSRKLEEIILVYILENNHITTKEKMLEVYLNVIEWGPNVYGIQEASAFYFNKSASELTLQESLFLASIIPRPKKFMWQFDNQGTLKPSAVEHNTFIRNLMLNRALITTKDTIDQKKSIYLSGRARSFFKIKTIQDTISSDSLVDEFDF